MSGRPRPLTLRAHGGSYQLIPSPGLGSGKAPSKVERCMRRGVPYEQHLLEHIYSLGLTGVAVDAGANVGNHTLWLAAICGLRVHAFEPIVPAELDANVHLNGLQDRITVHPVALGDTPGRATHLGQGRLDTSVHDGVAVERLDDYQLTDVTVIKADVEGMEPQVLRGGERTIRTWRPVIFAEEWAGNPKWHDGIAAVLEPLGYQMTHRFAGRESPTPVGKWEHEAGL